MPRALKLILAVLFALAYLGAASVKVNAAAMEDSEDQYYKSMLIKCDNLKRFSERYCICVINVSKQIPENDPILNLFLTISKDKKESDKLYHEIISGDDYSRQKFDSLVEKKDFVGGQSRLFASRIQSKCHNLD
ncbi:hypothetical protein EV561_1089 [Rhizobium sp. BK376]|nr:hypothetical protein EV561_1089 [Rhizobium sp. BK376]